jgi:hypothetical protein
MKKEKLKTKEQIVTEMCIAWRHDYGLVKDDPTDISSGMTIAERKELWNRMHQLFENSIKPYMKHKKKKDAPKR